MAWVDTKTPTQWKWVVVAVGCLAGVVLAAAPIYVGFKGLHGWPFWVVVAGVVITLLSTFVLQSNVVLTVLALASFAFCANVSSGHMLEWAFAWLATSFGALVAHSFLVDMSWLYHALKVSSASTDVD
jgi:hypothetical protein